jgi:hypothetical protein
MTVKDIKHCSEEGLQYTILETSLFNMLQLYLRTRYNKSNSKETVILINRVETCLHIRKGSYLFVGYDRGLLAKASLYIGSKSLCWWYINKYYVSGHYPSSCLYLKTPSCFSFKTRRFGDWALQKFLFWRERGRFFQIKTERWIMSGNIIFIPSFYN